MSTGLSALMPWEIFRDTLGETISESGREIVAVLWYRDEIDPMGRQYQYLELEVGTDVDPPLAQNDIVIVRESRWRISSDQGMTYRNSRRYHASNEAL